MAVAPVGSGKLSLSAIVFSDGGRTMRQEAAEVAKGEGARDLNSVGNNLYNGIRFFEVREGKSSKPYVA